MLYCLPSRIAFKPSAIAVAADDDQLALFEAERNPGCFGSALDRDRLVVRHAVHHVETALRREAREKLTGDLLTFGRIPKGVLGGHHVDLWIGFDCLVESLHPSKRRCPPRASP